jgi:hypothetical protein
MLTMKTYLVENGMWTSLTVISFVASCNEGATSHAGSGFSVACCGASSSNVFIL